MRPAGLYRERIKVSRPERTQNPINGTWETIYRTVVETNSDVLQKDVSIDLVATRVDFMQPFEFNIRYRPDADLKKGDTIEWRGRTFVLDGFSFDIRRTDIKIMAITDTQNTAT